VTRRFWFALTAAAASGAFLLITANGIAQNAPGDDDPVLKAMHDEMDRSRQLRVVGGQDMPYFFSYDLTDSENLHITATLGSAVNVSRQHARFPSVEVRVGDYNFDNTGHIYSGLYSGSRYDGSWPLDDNYQNLRDGFWLATDHTYKAALESMGRKRASIKNTANPPDPIPDFSKADPVVSLPKVSHRKIDDAAWTARVAKLSGVFKSYPEVLTSSVDLEVIDGITDLVNSEGTAVRYSDKVNWLQARADSQAPDGMFLRDALSVQALDLDKLPADAELEKDLREMGDHVRDLLKAPLGSSFTGPALFEPQAAAQLLAQLIGDNLRVPRKPLSDPGRNINFQPSEFETRIGARVLPDWMDVSDDPTQSAFNGKPLMGFYSFDLEGVAPKPVNVIEKGTLKAFLTTRQPIKGFPVSNGHARLAGSFGASAAAIGNMFVKAGESTPLADLKKRLISMVQERNLPYGMLVRKLDFPYSGGAGDLQSLRQASQQAGARAVSPPLLVYRVYPDGHEELVRGLRFRGLSSRALRDILAASQETTLFSYINNGAPLAMMNQGGYLSPTSVVSPGLLFDEIEFEMPMDQLSKPAVVPPPNAPAQ
jgi:predicted Zn-dependent protease